MATKLLKGNTAVVIGALYAGSDCYFGYPITPASEVLHEASKYYPKLGRKFVQAESEEASINMCYGAADRAQSLHGIVRPRNQPHAGRRLIHGGRGTPRRHR